MEITARLYKRENEGAVKARGSICLNQMIVIEGIRVIEGKNGLFASMPSRQKQDGTYADVAFPITKEAREAISTVVLEAYNKLEG